MLIKLANADKFVKIDDEDYERCVKPYNRLLLHCNGYVHVNVKGYGTALLHRIVLQQYNTTVHIHHKDGDKLNNQKNNLECCEKAIHHSRHNLGKQKRAATVSVFHGVTYNKAINRWRAFVYHENKQNFLGSFITEVEAAAAYNEYVRKHKINRPLNVLDQIGTK